eukprot:COSAG05_NODE_9969_length_590_cov_0.938900_2_plen_22_part_01
MGIFPGRFRVSFSSVFPVPLRG